VSLPYVRAQATGSARSDRLGFTLAGFARFAAAYLTIADFIAQHGVVGGTGTPEFAALDQEDAKRKAYYTKAHYQEGQQKVFHIRRIAA
jgi:hypothetical protein